MKHPSRTFLLCWIVCLGGFSISTQAQFISDFGVSKTGYYTQSSDAPPALDPVDNHEFVAWIVDSGQSEVDGATVTLPGGLGGIDLMPFLYYWDDFSSQAGMDASYKSGTYRFQATSVDFDVFFQDLTLTGDAYPNPPQLVNFTALQTINASADLNLQWVPFQGGTTSDHLFLYIDGDSGNVFTLETDGTDAAATIPAGTLTAGKTYDLYLTFARVTDVNSNDGFGEASYARETYVTIKASSGGTVTVNITNASMAANGTFQVQVSGTPNATFVLEGTTSFGGWTQVDSITPSTGTGMLNDTGTTANPHRFYRVKAM